LSCDERAKLIDRDDDRIPVLWQAELLDIHRSRLYYKPKATGDRDVVIKHAIDEIYTKYPFYGSRKISIALRRKNLVVNRKAVQRHMREMAIVAVFPGPNLSRRALAERVFPYLLRGVSIARPNHVWGIDITYIRMRAGWMYLAAIIDWFSRYVVSWEIDDTLEIDFVLRAVDRALAGGQPEIFNSDQGSHFTSSQYTDRLKNRKIAISMDGKGRALDNIFTERLWRSVKYEEVYLNEYETPREARMRLGRYLEFYNIERPHQSLGYRTPAEIYAAH
jgi:putative transposase